MHLSPASLLKPGKVLGENICCQSQRFRVALCTSQADTMSHCRLLWPCTKGVKAWQSTGLPSHLFAGISYDEKPGLQAIENTAGEAVFAGRRGCTGRLKHRRNELCWFSDVYALQLTGEETPGRGGNLSLA